MTVGANRAGGAMTLVLCGKCGRGMFVSHDSGICGDCREVAASGSQGESVLSSQVAAQVAGTNTLAALSGAAANHKPAIGEVGARLRALIATFRKQADLQDSVARKTDTAEEMTIMLRTDAKAVRWCADKLEAELDAVLSAPVVLPPDVEWNLASAADPPKGSAPVGSPPQVAASGSQGERVEPKSTLATLPDAAHPLTCDCPDCAPDDASAPRGGGTP